MHLVAEGHRLLCIIHLEGGTVYLIGRKSRLLSLFGSSRYGKRSAGQKRKTKSENPVHYSSIRNTGIATIPGTADKECSDAAAC